MMEALHVIRLCRCGLIDSNFLHQEYVCDVVHIRMVGIAKQILFQYRTENSSIVVGLAQEWNVNVSAFRGYDVLQLQH